MRWVNHSWADNRALSHTVRGAFKNLRLRFLRTCIEDPYIVTAMTPVFLKQPFQHLVDISIYWAIIQPVKQIACKKILRQTLGLERYCDWVIERHSEIIILHPRCSLAWPWLVQRPVVNDSYLLTIRPLRTREEPVSHLHGLGNCDSL